MPLKVKKHKRNKIPSHRNKKKLRRRTSKAPKIQIDFIAKQWDHNKSAQKNLASMGLASDPNYCVRQAIKHPERKPSTKAPKGEIAKLLEKEAKAPRMKKFKFPNAQAMYYTYLIKKYGDNYKEMAKDSKNVYQETWKKIRSRVAQFKKLEQYQKFMSR